MKDSSRICFVMPSAYKTIIGDDEVGGAELQSWYIARGLAKKYEVYMIVKAERNGREMISGVNVIRISSSGAGFYFNMLKSLLKLRPDVIYQRTGGNITIVLSILSRILRSRFFFHVSRDEQLDSDYPQDGSWLLKRIYMASVKASDTIITQKKEQFRKIEHDNKYQIPNMIDIRDPHEKKEDFVLWVASITPEKRPDVFLELAKKIPEIRFKMIGKLPEAKYRELYFSIRSKANKINNLDFLSQMPLKKVDEYFSRARVFVNTSSLEGFPNTFLQAWKFGVPVLSLEIDPDSVISKNKLGFLSGSRDNLERGLEILMRNNREWKKMSKNALEYIKRHDTNRLIPEYERVFTT